MRGGSLGRVACWAAALLGLTHCGGPPDAALDEGDVAQAEAALTATATFGAVADARVEAAAPTTNFGSSRTLMADLSPQSQSYLRFNVTGLSGTVTRAVVRLYAVDGSSDGPRLFLTAGGWSESTVNWNNRPAPSGSALGDKGAVSSGTWMEYDVTSAVKGNGELNLALVASSTDGTDVASRQADSASQRPQLVVTTDSGAPPPPSSSCGELITQEVAPDTLDGTVARDQPDTDFSTLSSLVVDGSPLSEAALRFHLDEQPNGPPRLSIVKAVLRLYAFDGSSDGPAVYRAIGLSEHQDLTWNLRPTSVGGVLGDKGTVAANSWVEYDVTAGVDPFAQDIAVAFLLRSTSSDATRFYSREASDPALRPQLIVTRSSGCTYRGNGGGALTGFRTYGGTGDEWVLDSATDRQGGIVVLGEGGPPLTYGGATFNTSSSFVLARYDAAGVHLWSRSYATSTATSDVSPHALTVTPEGMLLVVGSYSGALDLGTGPLPTVPQGGSGMFIAKFGPNGHPMWSQGFLAYQERAGALEPSSVHANDVATDANGSLIVVGSSYGTVDLGGGALPGGRSSTEDTPGLVLAKFRWDGVHLWSTGVDPGSCLTGVSGKAVATDAAGNVLVGGRTCQTALGGSGPETPFTARYSSTGVQQWVRSIGGVFGEVSDVAAGAGGAVHVAGKFKGRFTFAGRQVASMNPEAGHEGNDDMLLATYRADGSEAWVRDLGGSLAVGWASRLAVDGAGNLAVIGFAADADLGGGTQALGGFVARYSSSGAHLWSRIVLGQAFSRSVSVQPSGSVVVSYTLMDPLWVDGRTFTSLGFADLLLLQFGP